MRYVLRFGVLVWFNFQLSQAAFEHESSANQEKRFGDIFPTHGTLQDAVCTEKIYREILQCLEDLILLARNGFPWAQPDMTDQIRNYKQNQSCNLGDPLDPINHVCEVFGDSLKCIDQHAIPRECMVSGDGTGFVVHTTFQFICHIQPRRTDLLHSLQCLKESRVLALLVLYLADRSGTHIDDMVQGNVNALFALLMNSDIEIPNVYITPFTIGELVCTGLICLPESVIYHDVTFIVDRKCGSHAAGLVRDFYLYYRTRFNGVLSKLGLPTNICDKETRRKPAIGNLYATPGDTQDNGIFSRLFQQFLEKHSPGTAMDTPFGHRIRSVIASEPDGKFCNPVIELQAAFQACLLLSYDPSGKARFNILLYAHAVINVPFSPYPDSSSLKIFRSCWNLLQQMCGQNTSYLEYDYHVSVGSREIQRMMDTMTCEWQDTLMRLYIKASQQGNIWPAGLNANNRLPMFLSEGRFSFGSQTDSMSDLISVVTHGLKEISAKCSTASAKRMELFYNKLEYFWYHELKLYQINYNYDFPSQIPRHPFMHLVI